ncbi:MAG: response regulator, partial [Anaerolineae bacterium]|nr:response regulator [Anaerolineae bacterium]
MTFSTITIVVLLFNGTSAVVAAALLMMVLWQAPRARMNQWFAAAMFMQFLYSVANGFGRFIDDLSLHPYDATFIAVSFYGMYVVLVFFFASEFADYRTRTATIMRILGVVLAVTTVVGLWNDVIITDVYPSPLNDGSYEATWSGPGYMAAGLTLVYVFVSMLVLRRMKNERGRALWRGPAFMFVAMISSLIIWPLFNIPLQAIFLAVAALALGLPVLRYEFLNPRKQAHAALAEKYTALRDAYRMKSQFLANMSHELRTPLNSIIGYTELVLNETYGALNETQEDRLNKVVRNGRNLLALINDVLDLNRIEAGRVTLERAPIPTAALLDQVAEIVEPLAAQNGLTLQRDYSADLPPVFADQNRLRQILTNIVANAVKFTPQGCVTIRARVTTAAIQFEIEDTGIGIPGDQYDTVFKEFEQVDGSTTREYEGTGLGLAITKRLVEMHGGRIWLTSVLGQGTTFYVTMPVHPDFTVPRPVADLNAPCPATVLVIDDSAESRLLLKDALTNAGYEVLTANSGLSGIARAKDMRPDLITLDVMMPGMDGWQVLRALKDNHDTRNIPVVIVSIADNRPLAVSLGAHDAVPKPLDRVQLLHVLRQTIQPDAADGDGCTRILVVDDEVANCTMLTELLTTQGFTVECAQGGRAALKWLKAHVPALVLLDLMMP